MSRNRSLKITPTLDLAERQAGREAVEFSGYSDSTPTSIDRAKYLFEIFCEREEAWFAFDTLGLVAWFDQKTRQDIVPIWPHEGGILLCKSSVENERVPIPIDDFIHEVLPSLEDGDFKLALFPIDGHDYQITDAKSFLSNLERTWGTFAKSIAVR